MMPPAPPDLPARLALRERPARRAVGHQRWNDLLFLHWRLPAGIVQAALPDGLFVDSWQGDAWVGIVPFFMERIRPAGLPPVPGISWFLELNVRTYVHDGRGRAGVWFFSLDCNQSLAVALARRFFHLPYFHARMAARREGARISYECQRHGKPAAAEYAWQPGEPGGVAVPGSFEFFLVERYLLFATDARGHLRTGRVHHSPYQIHRPDVTAWSALPGDWCGFSLTGSPDSVLGAAAVDVEVFALQSAG